MQPEPPPAFQRRYFDRLADGGVYVIAEAGVNHNGSLDRARDLVRAAAECGADAVKFQTFSAASLVTASAEKAGYQAEATGSDETQLEMLRALELSRRDHRDLLRECADCGIDFLSSPFDTASADFLVDELGLAVVKVGSGEITNGPMLLELARRRVHMILSTGMSDPDEVAAALAVVAFGLTEGSGVPTGSEAFDGGIDAAEHPVLAALVTLLHCTSEYPAPVDELNLRAMDTLRSRFGLRVGFSDHSQGIVAAIAACARGATIIEKHVTIDRSLPGPDHRASLEPAELGRMIGALRAVEAMLGDGAKEPARCETGNRSVARKSLVARLPIRRGEPLTPDNIAAKRPGTGVSPMAYWDLLGRPASRDYRVDEQLDEPW